ncbi:hypothetical protein Sps_01018 [Shewanella psychrophila]|uniref:Uncharacterized protein n=1 Tax=Shewanella psychrophila TaxID=225848 RepID=A0A1S6HL10_9GAMM|nr:hypothetical protein Sps_01018 [Shewanella psychrophila]
MALSVTHLIANIANLTQADISNPIQSQLCLVWEITNIRCKYSVFTVLSNNNL